MSRVLIAGVGNELRQDDAFGIEIARRLQADCLLSTNVKVLEVGIGGIHLVQELYNKYDILLVVDAVKWGGVAGTIYFKEWEVTDIHQLPRGEKRAFLADMHYTNPTRALMLAKALDILPPKVFFLGCEAAEDDFAMGLSGPIKAQILPALAMITKWLDGLDAEGETNKMKEKIS